MPVRVVRVGGGSAFRRLAPALAVVLLAAPQSLFAQAPSVSVGGGVQTSYVHSSPDDSDDTDEFPLNSVRLYVSGTAAPNIKIMFNTAYSGATNAIGVLDAAAQFEFSPHVNIWAGRFLPPSDRANMYGAYYANHWSTFTDGVQDGYPFVSGGRDNGVIYWGQFSKVKVSGGAFDGKTATGDDTVLTAGRLQVDFWDQEAGYYLNGSYYGDKNLLAVGLAGQVQGSDKSAWTADFLLEKKLGTSGTVSVESEYANYSKLGGYNANYEESDGGYVLGAYLFPKPSGIGTFQLLGKFAKATFENGLHVDNIDYDQKTTEFDVNYVIKQFNARVMFFFKNTDFSAVQKDFKQVGVGLQLQM